MPQVREFKIPRPPGLYRWKRIRVLLFFIAIIPTRLLCQMLENSPEVEAVQCLAVTPHAKEVWRKTFIKKGQCIWAMISLMKYPLSRTVFWVGCTFSLGCRTRAWHRNLGLIIEKWAFRHFQGWPKKEKMRISCNSVSNIQCHSKHVTTYSGSVGRPVSNFIISKSTTLHVHLIVLSTFHCHHCTIATWKCLISRFIEDVQKPGRTFFLSLSLPSFDKISDLL